MTWTNPKVWLNDEPLTAQDMNQQVSDNLSFLLSLIGNYTVLRDEQPSGTGNTSLTQNGWKIRPLNVRQGDADNNVALLNDQFTLVPGRYYVRAFAPTGEADRNRARIYNHSTSTIALNGTNARDTGFSASWVSGMLQPEVPSTYSLQHYTSVSGARTGWPLGNGDPEIFSVVELWRIG